MANKIIKAPDGTDLIRVKSKGVCDNCFFINRMDHDCKAEHEGNHPNSLKGKYWCEKPTFGNSSYHFEKAFE